MNVSESNSAAVATASNAMTATTLSDSVPSILSINKSGVESLDPGLASLQASISSLNGLETSSASNLSAEAVLDKVVEVLTSLINIVANLLNTVIAKKNPVASEFLQQSASSGVPSPQINNSGGGLKAPVTSSSSTSSPSTSSPSTLSTVSPVSLPLSTLNVVRNDLGQVSVKTFDGYTVRAEGTEAAWTITGPDGKSTRIWGDPHVTESDGDRWDFKNRSTFMFGKNKVTVEVVPVSNGETISARLNIYSGQERVTIAGIDTNKPTISAVSHDGREHDMSLADGITYKRGSDQRGEFWRSNKDGRVAT